MSTADAEVDVAVIDWDMGLEVVSVYSIVGPLDRCDRHHLCMAVGKDTGHGNEDADPTLIVNEWTTIEPPPGVKKAAGRSCGKLKPKYR